MRTYLPTGRTTGHYHQGILALDDVLNMTCLQIELTVPSYLLT